MQAILAQSSDLDEALDSFGDKGQKSWTAEEKRKDRKALSLIQLHLHNDILQEVLQEKTTVELWLKLESICMSKDLTSKMHVKMKLFTHKLQEGGSMMNHLSIFKEIVADLVSMEIKIHDGMIRTLKDVRHIPGMARNLISLNTLDAEGYIHSGSGGVCKVSKGSLIHMIGDMNSTKLYVLRGSTLRGSVTAATVSNDESSKTNLWHMRLGHMSELGMAELIKTDLLDGCTMGKMKFYEHCIFGKHNRVKFNASVHITKGTLDYVHVDLWGPSRKPSYGGARYMLTIIDDYSRKVWPYFLKNKDDTFAAFKEWKVMIERQTEKKPQNQSIADRRTKRNCGPRPHLIEECDMVHYAFSCAEQVENIYEPATYTEAVVSALQCASTNEDFEYMSRVPYSNDVGSLMYAMVCSRPDLSYAMSLVSRYMANPGKEYWKAVQWIFRYLCGTTNACLKFGKTDKGFTGYVNSDFAVDLDKRRSLTGYVFTIGGCANTWLLLKHVKNRFG
ncbi:unnamed protein product [Miscanthus lutarioriparius]|uniref:GAG-pre-integrase domain-containing protein n=1 Tax=Miscanthus lutarioriparius TaxID=422564 RepID=A0A811RRF6_9POAL|nr:unnamed protein product [Miscanthus lutarioriparius]